VGKTVAEKIFSQHCGRPCYSGELVVCEPDILLTHDANRPLVSEVLKEMDAGGVYDAERVMVVIDHHTPAPADVNANIHSSLREFAREQGARFFESEGICHQVLSESGLVVPGDLVIGSDSHMCTQGALNALAVGVGSTDLAVALTEGVLWFKVPPSFKIILKGSLKPGVYAKDVVLNLLGQLSARGAVYVCLEFTGDAISNLSIEARMTICNMAVESGAKAGVMPYDQRLKEWLAERPVRSSRPERPTAPDNDAVYEKVVEIDLERVGPVVSRPHRVDDVVPVEELKDVKIQQANLAGCAASRLEDLRAAAEVLKDRKVHPNVRLNVVPASQEILKTALREGIIETLVSAGAVLTNPSCKACSSGPRYAVPANGENVITSANRNFKGRLGNPKSFIYLASPATVAASAVKGYITDCRQLI
jgi:3-isopropylmalate/(R)-2-methylmalate dehydratase large subunit